MRDDGASRPGARPRAATRLAVSTLIALAATSMPLGAEPDDAGLQAEVARLRARIAELEAENARLRGAAATDAALERGSEQALDVTFDPDTDTTTISTPPSRLVRVRGGAVRHFLVLRATHRGRTPASVGDVQLVVQTAASSGDYRGATALRLVIDGAPEEHAVAAYASEPIVGGRTAGRAGERETVTVAVPAAALERMAAAREVRATLGRHEFALTPEQLWIVRALRRRLGA